MTIRRVTATLLVSAALWGAPPTTGAQPSDAPTDGTAPTVFYRTIGDGRDRLYRRVLDGTHLPELLAERPGGYDDDPQGAWWVSPDGSVVIRMGVLTGSDRGDGPSGGLEAIPLRDGAPSWRLERRVLQPDLVSWSADGRLVSDGRSLTDVTAGTTRDLAVPEDWEFAGFAQDDALLYQAGGTRDGTVALLRLDPGSGDRRVVPWGSVASTGVGWPSATSAVLGQALTTVDDPQDGESRVVLRDLRTGADTPVTGLSERAQPLGFDSTGRIPLVIATSRDESGVPARVDLSLSAVVDGSARQLWQGRGQVRPEPMLTADGRYLLTHPHYEDAALLLVALDGSGSVSIPVPGDVAQADPVRVIAGTRPPSGRLGLPVPGPLHPGEAIDGAPSILVTVLDQDARGAPIGRVRWLTPSTRGTVVRAETRVPIPPRTRADRMMVTAAPRPGHRDVLVLSGWWGHPWVYRWTPGREPRRIRTLGGFRALYGPIWSPDGRLLAIRVGSSGRRFAVFDEALRLRKVITLPRGWANADLTGWTTDSTRLVFDPPTFAYASGPAAPSGGVASIAMAQSVARIACENEMPMGTVSIATGRLVPHRGTRELSVRFGPSGARAATGEWTRVDEYQRGFSFEHGCPVRVTRSEVTLPGVRLRDMSWDPTGTTLLVVAGDARPDRILAYRRPWADPDQKPQVTVLDALGRYLGPVAPGGRWVVVEGEGRLDGRSTGLLDLRAGAIHWIDDAVSVQGWAEG